MSAKYFLDTNLLVYALDNFDPKKQATARTLLKAVNTAGSGVISTQVLQEFYVAAEKKMSIDPLVARDMLRSFDVFETIVISPELVYAAIDISSQHQLSFWDALIIAAADAGNCAVLLTEDLNDGQNIGGVIVRNPFRHYQQLIDDIGR